MSLHIGIPTPDHWPRAAKRTTYKHFVDGIRLQTLKAELLTLLEAAGGDPKKVQWRITFLEGDGPYLSQKPEYAIIYTAAAPKKEPWGYTI